MSRLNEYNVDFGVVFETEGEKWLREHPGSTAGGGGTTTAAAAGPTRPAVAPPAGFTQGSDPTSAYMPNFQFGQGRSATSGPAKYFFQDGVWKGPQKISAQEYNIGMQGAAGTATTTPGAAAATTGTPAAGVQPSPTINVNGQNVAAPPAQQLYTPERNLNQVILSNGRYANPDFQFGSRAFTATGAQPGYFAPGQMLSYQIGGGLPQGAAPPAPLADTRTQSSFQPNGPAVPQTGAPPPGFMLSTTGPLGGALQGVPGAAPAPVTGQVQGAPAGGQLPGGGAGQIDLSTYKGQWLSDGSAWFPFGSQGRTVPADIATKVIDKWSDTPGNIPQMLGIVARESGGKPTASNTNDSTTGAPGTKDVGIFQINELNWPSLGLNAKNVTDTDTNINAARALFDRNRGTGDWGGPDIYNPKGYNFHDPAAAAPPRTAVGPVGGPTGQPLGQNFEPTPTNPQLPPVPGGIPGGPVSWPPLQGQGQGGGGGGGGGWPTIATNPLSPLSPQALPGNPAVNPLAPLAPQAGAQVIANPLNPLEPIRLPGQFDPNAYRDTRSFLDMARQEGGGPRPGLLEQARAGATAPGLGYFDQLRAQQGQVPGAPAAGQALIVLDSGFTQPPPPTPQSFLQMARNAPTTIPPAIGSTATPVPFYMQPGAAQTPAPTPGPSRYNPLTDPLAQHLSTGTTGPFDTTGAALGGGAAAGQPAAATTQPAVDPLTVRLNLNGPQTVTYNLPGGAGGGYNPLTILQGFQRNGTGDPRVDSMMAKQLMDAQNSLITAGLSPLAARDALLAPQRQDALPIGGTTWVQGGAQPEQMQRTDAGYYFSPGGQTITPGGSPTTSGYQEMPFGSSGAYGDQPRFFAGGGSFLRGNQNGPVDSFALQRAIQDLQRNQTGYVPREDMRGYQPRPFANGGSFMTTQPTLFPMAGGGQAVTSEYGQPEMVTEHGRRVDVTPMATGGSFTTPKPTNTTYDAPPPPSTGTDLTNTGQQNLDYPAAPAPYNPPGGEAPTNQGNTQDPNPAPPPPPGALPPLSGFGGAMDTNPELANQLELARQQQARDTYGYQYRAAGVPLPTGISSMTRPDNLAPGQYWQPIDYTNQIQQLEARLAALGPQQGWTPLDPAQIALIRGGGGGEGPGLQGYRNPDPATADLMEMQNKQQLDRYMQAQDLMSQIGNLRASQPTPFQLPGGQPTSPFVGPQAFQDVVDRTPTGATIAALGQDAATGQWSPQSSDKLVQLATAGTDPAGLQALVQQLNAGRAIPPGLNPQAYKNPVAAAAAMKFTG